MSLAPALQQLLGRSHRLGADRAVTNHAGGNTSAKLVLHDAVTGEAVPVLAVKGSGGDLATLTESGLAVLVLDRVVEVTRRYEEGADEDDLVDLYDQCRFGSGGAPPSIDTPLHALVDADHVDHVHPDAVIALAVAADGERLVAECYGNDVGWLPWRRPGIGLALALRAMRETSPGLRGVVLGGHGLISWADDSASCEANTIELVERARQFLTDRGRPEPLGAVVREHASLPEPDRRRAAARIAPAVRGLVSSSHARIAHYSDAPVVLEFLERERASQLCALGTSCPDHFLRTKVQPLFVDAPADSSLNEHVAALEVALDRYRSAYTRYYTTHATPDSPPMRGTDPAIVLVPGIGMWSLGSDAPAAEIAGEFFVNAINVMRGAEAVSTYAPIPDAEKFAVEYWELEERKLRARPAPQPLAGRVALVTGAASGVGRAVSERFAVEGACVVIADIDDEAADKVAAALGAERALAVHCDVRDESDVDSAFAAAALRFGGVDIIVNNAGLAAGSPLVDTGLDEWDRLHDVLARGSFLVSRAAARLLVRQGTGGDIVYVVSKNAVAAGSDNVAYSAAKADQAHQVRLLAAELGVHGIRVNGVNPDAVVEGSGIFTSEWRAQRAASYGVAPEQLGEYYASRTLLGTEVLPEHVADAAFVLVSGALSRTTGMLVPVDGGVASAFLR